MIFFVWKMYFNHRRVKFNALSLVSQAGSLCHPEQCWLLLFFFCTFSLHSFTCIISHINMSRGIWSRSVITPLLVAVQCLTVKLHWLCSLRGNTQGKINPLHKALLYALKKTAADGMTSSRWRTVSRWINSTFIYTILYWLYLWMILYRINCLLRV